MSDDFMSACTTTREMAHLLGVSRQMLERLEESGHVRRASVNTWRVVDTLQGALRHARSQRSEKSVAEAELRRAKTRAVELTIAERAGRLLELEEAMQVNTEMVAAFVNELDAMPAGFARRDLSLRRELETYIRDMRQRLAKSLRETGEKLAG